MSEQNKEEQELVAEDLENVSGGREQCNNKYPDSVKNPALPPPSPSPANVIESVGTKYSNLKP